MAYVTRRKNGKWEVRESVRTQAGPRTRTLASFTELNEEVIRQAQSRASGRLEKRELLRAAARSGAPVVASAADSAAIELFEILESGERPRRALWRLMLDYLPSGLKPLSPDGRGVAQWLSSTLEQRGETLIDLLSLADALPQRRRSPRLSFPRLESR